jgi:hypothetical protein
MDTPEFYAVVNASGNITHRLQMLDRAMICNQGNEPMLREIITEILILVGIDTIAMIAYRETLGKAASESLISG